MTGGPSALRRSRMGRVHQAGQSERAATAGAVDRQAIQREIARQLRTDVAALVTGGIGPNDAGAFVVANPSGTGMSRERCL